MLFTALHFPSFIFFTWHVKLLEECKANYREVKSREKEGGQILKLYKGPVPHPLPALLQTRHPC